MGFMVYSLLWIMQDLHHQRTENPRLGIGGLGFGQGVLASRRYIFGS